MNDCIVEIEHASDVDVAALRGELTLANSSRVGRELEQGFSGRGDLVLDLSGLSFLDSAGIHLLFRVSRFAAARGGHMHFVIPFGAPSHRILRIVDPGGFIPVHETRADALAAIQPTSDGGDP
jgi:anti-sigma B factor antagonist